MATLKEIRALVKAEGFTIITIARDTHPDTGETAVPVADKIMYMRDLQITAPNLTVEKMADFEKKLRAVVQGGVYKRHPTTHVRGEFGAIILTDD